MSSSRLKKQPSLSGTALTAVALQDHLIRSLALTDILSPNNRIGAKIAKDSRPRKIVAHSVIDTGRGNARLGRKKPQIQEKEFVLDAKPPAPTLAQKMGIIDAPRQLLSETEWSKVKETSNKREDSCQPCAICKEQFGADQQVLLSCTHVFHRACLEAFERFSGRKSCPLCRKEQYQTRVIYEGAKMHRHVCATRIQALWRGYVVRTWYRKLRQTNPPKDPGLRKKFFEEKLASITDRMIRSIDYDIGDFLSEIDRSVAQSRRVYKQIEMMSRSLSSADWEEIQIKALARNDVDCPICLTAFSQLEIEVLPTAKITQAGNCAHNKTTDRRKVKNGLKTERTTHTNCSRIAGTPSLVCRETMLLSCSHIFHRTCLETFEELTMGIECHFSSCPVCRSAYQKRVIQIHGT